LEATNSKLLPGKYHSLRKLALDQQYLHFPSRQFEEFSVDERAKCVKAFKMSCSEALSFLKFLRLLNYELVSFLAVLGLLLWLAQAD